MRSRNPLPTTKHVNMSQSMSRTTILRKSMAATSRPSANVFSASFLVCSNCFSTTSRCQESKPMDPAKWKPFPINPAKSKPPNPAKATSISLGYIISADGAPTVRKCVCNCAASSICHFFSVRSILIQSIVERQNREN